MNVKFSVSISDCREEFFRGSGNGGQKKQKTSSGVRLTHEPSGVTVESEAQRSQHANRVDALTKLAKHPKFRAWCSMHAQARAEGFANVERKIDAAMDEKNLKIELTDSHAPGEAYCDVKSAPKRKSAHVESVEAIDRGDLPHDKYNCPGCPVH